MDIAHPIKTVSSKIVYRNPWITVHEDQTIMPSGKPGIYGYLESNDSVMTAVLDKTDRLYMVRGFRYPSKSWGWEMPGGGGDGEELTIAAQREVEEETGIKASHCEHIGSALVCNGLMTEKMAVCVADDISMDGRQDLGDEALGEMKFFTLDEIDALVEHGEINDGQTITALYYLQRWMKKRQETSA